ncbi:histidine phosphatase superfamily [Chytridium lagenaria]|nr:histidine phosphatase superfamily [Chytridium lagenaria]
MSRDGNCWGRTNVQALFHRSSWESIPNVKSLIISSPATGVLQENGLTDKGKMQAVEAGKTLATKVKELVSKQVQVFILSSDFMRARETAAEIWNVLSQSAKGSSGDSLKVHSVKMDERLRERYFGTFDGGPSTKYETVWKTDASTDESATSAQEDFGTNDVESARSVSKRVLSLLHELEDQEGPSNEHMVFILVSHGDTLQITQTMFEGISSNLHRSLRHLQTAEVRELVEKRPGIVFRTT